MDLRRGVRNGAAAGLASPAITPPAASWSTAASPTASSRRSAEAPVVTMFQPGHGWTVTGTPGYAEPNDTGTFVRGAQSALLTTNGTGAVCGIQMLGMAPIDLTGKAIRLLFKVDQPWRIGNLSFFVGTSSLANYFKWRFDAETASSRIALAGDWVVVSLQWSEINVTGGAFSLSATGVPSTTSGFTDMRFEVSDNGTGPVTVNLQVIEIIDAPVTEYPHGVVSIVFDDSHESAELLARPRMEALGFRGTQYTIAEAIGTPNSLTLPQLRSLQNTSGWEIAGHSYTASAHTARYPNLTAQQVDDELRNLRAWLVTNGFTGDSFAYPGGRYENTTDGVPVDQLVANYFASGRTILSSVGVSTHSAIDSIPPAMRYRLRGMSAISSTQAGSNNPTRLTATGGMLDRVAENSGWLTLVFHRVVPGIATDPTHISRADFNMVMDAVAARGMPVLPVGEVMRRAGTG